MYDETTITQEHEQQDPGQNPETADSGPREYNHCYFEVAGELLAKPNILCDFIEAEGHPATLVFCNSPSDADFVDVMLKKRGLSTKKLIGHVPSHRIDAALQQLASGEITLLIVTDVSAHGMDSGCVRLVINHSVPTDAQVYLERLSNLKNLPAGCRIVSLVSPLDFGNFHYLKKITQKEFQKLESPGGEALLKKRLENLHRQAQRSPAQQDEKILQFAALAGDPAVFDESARRELLVYLLHNTLNVMPSLSSSTPTQEYEENEDERPRRDDDRRGGRRGGGFREREGRDNRRSSRQRGRYRAEQQESFDDVTDSEYPDAGRVPEFTAEHQRAEGQRRMRAAARVERDIRFYVGHGSKSGFSRENLLKLMQERFQQGGGEFREEALKRFNLRELYSFVDVPEELASSVQETMRDATLPDGEKLFMTRTVSISARSENQPDELEREPGDLARVEDDGDEILDDAREE